MGFISVTGFDKDINADYRRSLYMALVAGYVLMLLVKFKLIMMEKLN